MLEWFKRWIIESNIQLPISVSYDMDYNDHWPIFQEAIMFNTESCSWKGNPHRNINSTLICVDPNLIISSEFIHRKQLLVVHGFVSLV